MSPIEITTGEKKKFQSSVWRVVDYDLKKKKSSRLSGGLSVWRVVDYNLKKKKCQSPVVCLAQNQKMKIMSYVFTRVSLLLPEKKKFGDYVQSSVWRVRDRYDDRKIKKFQSSVWRVRERYYDRKNEKFQSSVWRVRVQYYDRKKKSSSRLSGGCAIVITTGK